MTANNGVAATFCRRVASQNNHPYLIKNNNNNHHGIDVARIRKAVSEIAAKEKNSEHFVPVKVEAVEAVKTEQGSGVDAFIAIMVHASKCKWVNNLDLSFTKKKNHNKHFKGIKSI